MTIYELSSGISSGVFDDQFKMLYGSSERNILKQRARYLSAAENFSRLYPECGEIGVFSVGGRTEIGGNHTDHQHGCVLAAAVDADIIAIAARNRENEIHLVSEGFEAFTVDLDNLSSGETGTSVALVRGILYGFKQNGINAGGFDVYISSEIPVGCGMSSSAAFETLVGNIINSFFGSKAVSDLELAKICQRAENDFYGKNCGIMDQVVCAYGGFIFADLGNPVIPVIKKIDFDFRESGYSLCITNTSSNHTEINAEYDTIVSEMKHVAEEIGYSVLGEADEEDLYRNISHLRTKCSDREILRAAHFFDETKRAAEETEALEKGDTEVFFELINSSGNSSAQLLQNLFSSCVSHCQEIPLAIMISKRFLCGSGAVRVHGGGFGGSVIAFVPNYLIERYSAEMGRIFGECSCRVLNIRPVGGYELVLNITA